jgi:hypothetical protein
MKEALFEDEFIPEEDEKGEDDQHVTTTTPCCCGRCRCIRLSYITDQCRSMLGMAGHPHRRRHRWQPLLVVGGVVVGFVVAVTMLLSQSSASFRRHHRRKVTSIAHIGNSFQFVNDFPRVLQTMATERVVQDSVLHGSLSIFTLPNRGNGMRNRWHTRNAWNSTLQLHDYGACTLSQLLMGYDEYLLSADDATHYKNDGKNPCFAPEQSDDDTTTSTDDDDASTFHGSNQDDDDDNSNDDNDNNNNDDDDDAWQQDIDDSQAYLEYTVTTKTRSQWDFVVMNDQSLRPAVPYERQKSINSLQTTYLPMFQASHSTVVFLMTHAYSRPNVNLTSLGLSSIPMFTAKTFKGYHAYAKVLSAASVPTRLAPVAIAFLTVWEENGTLWNRLFGPDSFHPSPHGTYLQACVVHATIFGYLPDAPTSNDHVADYFVHSRSMQLGKTALDLPTKAEALYLRSVAERVVLQNYLPSSFRKAYSRIRNDDNE